jgi:hypothetical protein
MSKAKHASLLDSDKRCTTLDTTRASIPDHISVSVASPKLPHDYVKQNLAEVEPQSKQRNPPRKATMRSVTHMHHRQFMKRSKTK